MVTIGPADGRLLVKSTTSARCQTPDTIPASFGVPAETSGVTDPSQETRERWAPWTSVLCQTSKSLSTLCDSFEKLKLLGRADLSARMSSMPASSLVLHPNQVLSVYQQQYLLTKG